MDDKIFERPWSKKLYYDVLKITETSVIQWCKLITKIGETDVDLEEYLSIFIHHVQNLYHEMVTDVESILEKSLDNITNLLQRLENLCRDLHTEMPILNHEGVSLYEIQRNICKEIETYELLAATRRKELHDLLQQQMKLCKRLGQTPKIISESSLPQPNELEALRNHIEFLENEAFERENTFFQLQEEIVNIVNDLKVTPSLKFEKEILNWNESDVKITDSEMKQLNKFWKRVHKQFESVKSEVSDLRIKIEDLWNKLEIDNGERDIVCQRTNGNSLETLNLLKQEFCRLEEIRKANIKVFIDKQKQELLDLWEKCHTAESDRSAFYFFNNECYNDDLFDFFAREIDKWKIYYSESQELFLYLDKFTKVWDAHLELELISCEANRYKNRGGQLLVEEKLRNKYKKQIPKIEKRLRELAELYLLEKGRDFMIFGLTVDEYINKLHANEEQQHKLKLSAKKIGRDNVSIGNPVRQNSKRKIITTPATEPIKKIKTTSQKKSKLNLPKLNVSQNRRKRRSILIRKRFSLKSRKSSDKENHTETLSTSYSDFERNAETYKNCRSTTFGLEANATETQNQDAHGLNTESD